MPYKLLEAMKANALRVFGIILISVLVLRKPPADEREQLFAVRG